ncbi:photosystem I reaction center subunit IX [uncultured Nevskia sp.]|uniref:WD40/YVTN/BNR-like repeat-containing protein n=1 Tax=uncultured Nevskia sp. TaxID=228950 RepID=UPI0025D09718|nr:photosystem I reaction center subunit IX [uncultured Nevskia sp.]
MKAYARPLSAVFLVLMAVAGSFAMAADGGASRALNQLTPHDRLYSVAFSGDFGEAVGDGGLVLVTTDGGKTWVRENKPPTDLSLLSVVISGTRSIAVGLQGLILIRDEQKPWRKIEPVTDRRLLRVSLNKDGLAIATGAFGTLLKSTDGGETWADLKPDWATLYETGVTGAFEAIRDEPTIYVAKVFDDGSMIIGGEFGQLNRSSDGGTSWEPVFQVPAALKGSIPSTIFGMHFSDDGVGYATGQAGLVVTSSDSGKTWTQLDTHSEASLFDIAPTQDGHVVAIGMRSGLVSADAGKTWQPLKALDVSLNWYCGLSRGTSTPSGSVIAVGHSGRVLQLATSGN